MNSNKIVLVSCSSRKSDKIGVKNSLSDLSFPFLNDIRNQIIGMYLNDDYTIYEDLTNNIRRNNSKITDLNWDHCLPAYKRYRGQLFTNVTEENWQKSNNVLIVSPIWGLIKPEDKIPDYNLEMTDIIISEKYNYNNSIWKIWRPKLENLLIELSQGQQPYTLLFQKCSLGFSPKIRELFIQPVNEWEDNYGFHKGRWLNEYL